MPKFSIILPVRNGGEYLQDCVNSILSQTSTDFDLLLLDNNSNDGTLEYVQSIQDDRIRIYPSRVSLSIEENWGRILRVPRNEFMTFIGHDDLLYPRYLETINELINKYPNASLYQTHFDYIDARGRKIRSSKPEPEVESPAEFLRRFLVNDTDVMGTGFMMRSADYDQLNGIPQYPNLLFADFELWINLAKISFKAASSEECFAFRLHQSTTSVSADVKFNKAFSQFINFLRNLKIESRVYDGIIQQNAARFLTFYCKGLCHRLLRTPLKKREGLTVKGFINQCREYATELGVESQFHPENLASIRVARFLDSTVLGRSAFLFFKNIYSKPVLK